jgi:YebC/PmpR family DNA-binding regulatory protein
MAVKQSGPDPEANLRLRIAILNARAVNMPKDNIESAIKRAASKDASSFQEVVYEGYGPHGIAIVAECATDNPTRTVGNIRMYFSHSGGSLGTTGSLDFMFERKGIFKLSAGGVNVEELELELIDHGAEEVFVEEGEIFVYTAFNSFKSMQSALDARGVPIISSEILRVPSTTTELNGEQQKEILDLIEKLEDDDDVQAVFHNMKEPSA